MNLRCVCPFFDAHARHPHREAMEAKRLIAFAVAKVANPHQS
jgi:hypothetical protein